MPLSAQAQALLAKFQQGDTLGETSTQQAASPLSSDAQSLLAKYQVESSPKESAPTSLSPEASSLLSKYQGGITTPIEQSSGTEAIGKGIVQNFGGGPITNGIHYLESKFPNVMGALDDAGGLDNVYGQGFSSDTTTDQQRRDMITAHTMEWKSDIINKYYNGVDVSNHPILNKVGQFLGGLADPTTLANPEVAGLTWTNRAKEVAVFGAKLGAAQGATDELAKTGIPVNMQEISQAAATVAVDTIVGAAAGATLHVTIGEPLIKLSGLIRGAKVSGEPIGTDEVLESLKTSPRASQTPSEGPYNNVSFNTAGEMSPGTPVNSITFPVAEKIANDLNTSLNLGVGAEAAKDTAIVDHIAGNTNRSIAMIDHDYKLATTMTLEPKTLGEAYKVSEGRSEAIDAGVATKPVEGSKIEVPAEVLYTDVNPETTATTQLLKQSPQLAQKILLDSKASQDWNRPGISAAIEAIKEGDIKIASETGQGMHPPMDGGGDAGNGVGGPPDTSGGDGNDAFTPSQKVSLGSKSLTFLRSVVRPQTVWKSLGDMGNTMSSLFTRWNENVRMNHGQWMKDWAIIKNKYELNEQDQQVVRSLLNRTTDKATGKQMAAYKETRTLFDNRIKAFADQGIITKERANQLYANADKHGYFPHIYDKSYMSSIEGKQDFIDTLASVQYANKTAAIRAVRSIMGEKGSFDISNHITDNGDGTYKVVPSIAEVLYNKSTTVGDAGLSSHMEKDRIYPPELEAVLQKFMTRDMDHAMSSYSHDTAMRLETAKVWGNNNERYAQLYHDSAKQNKAIADSFKEAFWKQQGDPRSWNVQTFLNAPEWTQNMSSTLRNLQLLKLTFSGITNSTQLPVNGAMFLSSKVGLNGAISPYQALKSWAIGNAKGWGGKMGEAQGFLGNYIQKIGQKQWADEARMMGAVGEHVYADLAGRIADASKLGLALDKVPIIGNLIKDPGTWLDLVRFNATEDINRIGGYHMGKGYVMQLLKNKAALEALGEGHYNPKKMANINAALEEMGVTRDISLNTATISHLENAAAVMSKASEDMSKAIALGAQRVSNIINFVNDAHEMPRMYNSFMGKMMWQLKRFTYGQGVLANKYAIQPALKGNILPLAIYLGLGTGAGMGVNKLRAWINGDDRQLTLTKQVLDAQANVASFGIMQSLISSMPYGRGAMLAELAGPGPSQIAGIGTALGDEWNQAAYQGKYNLNPVLKEVIRQISLPDKRGMLNALTPEKDPMQAMFKAKGLDQSMFGKKEQIGKAPFEGDF